MRKVLLILGILIVYAIVVFVSLPLESLCFNTLVCVQDSMKSILVIMLFVGFLFFAIAALLSVLALDCFIVTPADIERDVERALREKERRRNIKS